MNEPSRIGQQRPLEITEHPPIAGVNAAIASAKLMDRPDSAVPCLGRSGFRRVPRHGRGAATGLRAVRRGPAPTMRTAALPCSPAPRKRQGVNRGEHVAVRVVERMARTAAHPARDQSPLLRRGEQVMAALGGGGRSLDRRLSWQPRSDVAPGVMMSTSPGSRVR